MQVNDLCCLTAGQLVAVSKFAVTCRPQRSRHASSGVRQRFHQQL